MENLLYYPYINMPKTNWTVRSLLYYDQIGSIVPMDYFYNPDRYDPFMRELVERELVLPINPMEQFDSPWQVCKPFVDYMNSKDFNLKRRKKSFEQKDGHKIFESKFQGSRIHTNKFDHELLYQIEQAGLATREDNHEWFWVEQKTAGELMMFLASVLGKKIDFLPATDLKIKSNPFFLTKKRIEQTKQKREIILENLIPFPHEIDITKLTKFKEKNSELLKNFKNGVELIAINSDIEMGSDLFKEKITELELGKNELMIKMNENKLGKIFFGTFCGISGAVIGLATAGTTGAIIGGLPSFANAIHSALQIEGIKDIENNKGMKYIALVDKELRKQAANN